MVIIPVLCALLCTCVVRVRSDVHIYFLCNGWYTQAYVKQPQLYCSNILLKLNLKVSSESQRDRQREREREIFMFMCIHDTVHASTLILL